MLFGVTILNNQCGHSVIPSRLMNYNVADANFDINRAEFIMCQSFPFIEQHGNSLT